MMDYVFDVETLRRLVWVLAHFVWQGALIALLAAALLRMLRNRRPQERYAVAAAALLLMAVTPVATFAVYRLPAPMTSALLWIAGAAPGADAAETALRSGGVMDQWIPLLALAWMSGVGFCALRLTAGWLKARRLVRLSQASLAGPLQDLFESIRLHVGLTRPVRLSITREIGIPLAVGCWRPVVLLPVTALTGLDELQLRAVLAHELAHIRRHDFLVNLLQRAVESLLFYHPAVWWLSARVRAEREHCCDDLAVQACGDPLVYAGALVELERLRLTAPAVAMAATGGGLTQRIRRVLGQETGGADWREALLVWTFALTVLIAAAWSPNAAWAQETPESAIAPASAFAVAAVAETMANEAVATAVPVTAPASAVGILPEVRELVLALAGPTAAPVAQAPTASTAADAPAPGRIEGVVIDGNTREPLADVQLMLGPNAAQAVRAATDASGRFSFGNIEAGMWRLCGTRPGYLSLRLEGRTLPGSDCVPVVLEAGQHVQGTLPMFRAPVVAGRVLDLQGRPIQGARVVPYRLGYDAVGERIPVDGAGNIQTNDLGEFRFNNLVPGQWGFRVEFPSLGLNDVRPAYYYAAFYPGVDDPLRAEFVDVAPGSSIQLRDVLISAAAGSMLRVRVATDFEEAASARIVVAIQRVGEGAAFRSGVLPAGVMETDIGPLPPGAYEITAELAAANLPRLRSFSAVHMGASDTNIDLSIPRPGIITGRFITESAPGATSDLVPGVRLRLTATSPEGRDATSLWPLPDPASSDGAIMPLRVTPGTYRLSTMGLSVADPVLPGGMYIAAIEGSGQDLLRNELQVRSGDNFEITVVLGRPAARIYGIVRDSQGAAVPNAVVALLPEDRSEHYRIASVAAAADGSFEFGAAPGAYRLHAWTELDGAAYRNAEFMRSYEESGVAIRVERGSESAVDVPAFSEHQ